MNINDQPLSVIGVVLASQRVRALGAAGAGADGTADLVRVYGVAPARRYLRRLGKPGGQAPLADDKFTAVANALTLPTDEGSW